MKDGQTNVATRAAVLAKASCRSGTWRRWQLGRAAGSQVESSQTFLTPPVPPPQHQKKNYTKPQSPPDLDGAWREEGKWGRPCSASTLRLRLGKSPRVKHDLHQGENQYHQSGRGPPREMFGRGGGAFPTKAQNATIASSGGSAITTPALRPPSPAPRGCLCCV